MTRIHAAYLEITTEVERVDVNERMLHNLLDAFGAAATGLRHIVLLQGTKYYGCHLGPFKTPVKESDPRNMPPNLYNAMEDHLLRERSFRNLKEQTYRQ